MATSHRFAVDSETQPPNVTVSRSWSLIYRRNSSESPERAIADLAFRRKFDKSFLIEWWQRKTILRATHARKTLTIVTAKTCFANALAAKLDNVKGSLAIPIDKQWREQMRQVHYQKHARFRFSINYCIVQAIKRLRYVKFLKFWRETIKRLVFIMSITVLLELEWNEKCFNQPNCELCCWQHYREIHFFAHFPATLIDADTTATSEIFSARREKE